MSQKKQNKYFNIFTAWLKKYLKGLAIKKLFGKAIGGIKGWLFTLAFDLLWKKVLLPGLKYVKRRVNRHFKKKETEKQLEKLKDAKNEDEFNDSFDNLN